ncbi:MAG TPA: thioredoxin family protein [Desulfobacterales bacterium]|nr:thioredoxin family protein [Desulfobacterales bacterium]
MVGMPLAILCGMKQFPPILIWAVAALLFLAVSQVSAAETRMLYFYYIGCPWCAKMDKVLRQPDVDGLLRRHAEITRINIQGRKRISLLGQSGLEAAKKFKVYGTPTIIFMSVAGKEILRIPGALNRQDFLDVVCRYLPGMQEEKDCRLFNEKGRQ